MKAFYDDVKNRMNAYDRKREDCVILVALDIITAETESIARQKQAYANELVTAEHGLLLMNAQLGIDVTQYPLDEPLVDIKSEEGSRGMLDIVLQGSHDKGLTLRQTAKRYATSAFTPQIVGTPSQVADELEHYFQSCGCDGFILAPTTMPGTFEQIVRMVVPELQRRGLFRKEYRHETLRQTMLTAE
jgi:alkanesulfonate monooxygenase SsuD/methylene tetrahydromethanopterin reductase-like flavin-dependent oxidoreductase (luciferase family)